MTVDSVIYEQTAPSTARQHIKSLITAEAARHGITYDEIMGLCRHRGGNCRTSWGTSCPTKPIVQARHACMALVRDTVKEKGGAISYPRLGRIFGRHHSTIMSGVARHHKNLLTQAALAPTPEIASRFDDGENAPGSIALDSAV